jgi:transcription elongation factor Elf1
MDCPVCGSEESGTELGVLGTRHHYRCSACGIDFSNDDSVAEEVPRYEEPERVVPEAPEPGSTLPGSLPL